MVRISADDHSVYRKLTTMVCDSDSLAHRSVESDLALCSPTAEVRSIACCFGAFKAGDFPTLIANAGEPRRTKDRLAAKENR